MKNNLLHQIKSLTRKLRERVKPSQDSPISSCCLTLPYLNQLLRTIWCKVSHRYTTTGFRKSFFKKCGKDKKDDTKNLEYFRLARLKSLTMLTLERKVTEVGEYLSKLEEDFSSKISNNKHFSVKVKSIIDDKDINSNQKLALLAEMIDNIAVCLEKNWENFPDEVFQFFEKIILKISELENEDELSSVTNTDDETIKSVVMLSRSLEGLKVVLQDIVQFVEISKFVRNRRIQVTDITIKKKAEEIIKKAKNSEKDSQSLENELFAYLKSGYDKKL